MKILIISLIKLYRYALSPFLGPNCRFLPTCSDYAIEAVQMYGVVKGSWFAVKRILRCRPGVSGGIDPLPKLKG
mgnify:FL=1